MGSSERELVEPRLLESYIEGGGQSHHTKDLLARAFP